MVLPSDDPGLLERDAQLAHLERSLGRARDGRGGVAVLRAGAGLGKTVLLRAAQQMAGAAGFRVLSARCSELEREMSFGIARQLFERELVGLDDVERAAVVGGAAELALPAVTTVTDPPRADPDAVVHGLYWLIVNLAGLQPVAVTVDDAHWADDQSLRWLLYLAPRIAAASVFVLVAGRPADPGAETSALARIAADEASDELELDPLDGTGVRALLARGWRAAPDEAFLEACLRSTGGNPFFVTELARVIANAGLVPDAAHAARVPSLTTAEVARSITTRLERLGEAEHRLANAVAVLDSDADVRHAAKLSGLSLDEALAAADLLIGAEIFRVARPLAFIHPIARAAVYEQLPAGAASRAHRQAAELLATEGAAAERVGAHALGCEPAGDRSVTGWLRAAAGHAFSAGAPDGAARYLVRALAEPPPIADRAQLSYELGLALVGIDVAGATRRFADAATGGSTELKLLAYRWQAQALGFGGDPAGAVAAAERAVALAGDDHELRLLLSATRDFYALAWSADPDRAARSHELQQRARGLAGATPGQRRALSVAAFDIARTGDAPAARALEYGGRVRDALATWLDADAGVETAAGIGESSIIADDPDALARHERASAEATRRGRFTNAGAASAQIGQIHFRLGSLHEAEADARTSWNLLHGQREGATTFYWWSAGQLLEILIARGELAEARALVESTEMASQPFERLCTFISPPAAPVVLGELTLAEGDLHGGIELLMQAGRWLEDAGWLNPAVNTWRARVAPALAIAGRIDEARAVIEPAVHRARTFGAPWALGMNLRAAGTVAEGKRALALLHEAIDVLAAAGCKIELAHAKVTLGSKLRRENQRAQARDLLRSALDVAYRCGAMALADIARDELAATGARPRRMLLTGVDSLTASERRVAQLAAGGLSNPEIAQRLFITRKTVETHLGHVYLKLDIASRADLASVLTGAR